MNLERRRRDFDSVDRGAGDPVARLLGSDALKGPGVDVAWLAPTPWFAELRVSYQALTPGFLGQSRNAGVGRLLQFFDVSDAATLGLGVSGAVFDEPGAGASRRKRLAPLLASTTDWCRCHPLAMTLGNGGRQTKLA